MASALGKFLRISSPDRGLLVRALFTLAAARVAIWILPFGVVRRLLTPRPRGTVSPVLTRERIRWAIGHAQRVIPDATCLPQAVAAESLLIRGGHAAQLRIGVMKTPAGKFIAHAWVVSEGRIVIGALPRQEMAQLTPLPPLPGPDAR